MRNSPRQHTPCRKPSKACLLPRCFSCCLCFEDRFLYIMKNLPTIAEKPELWDDPYFEDIMTEAEYANMDRHERDRFLFGRPRSRCEGAHVDFAGASRGGKGSGREKIRGEPARPLCRTRCRTCRKFASACTTFFSTRNTCLGMVIIIDLLLSRLLYILAGVCKHDYEELFN